MIPNPKSWHHFMGKKSWHGLTLKDMPDDKFGRPEWLEGVNWAEAKLKEKNT